MALTILLLTAKDYCLDLSEGVDTMTTFYGGLFIINVTSSIWL